MSEGYQVVQSCHSVADFTHKYPHTFNKWKLESNSIICLSVKNEFELQKIKEKFIDKTDLVIFWEPDVSEYTSLCLYGSPEIRKKLKHLPLLLKNN